MPLNIDLQQILLHWMNLAILTGGLYFLLYKPVKDFMAKREAHYRSLDEEASAKLAGADEEIRHMKAKSQQAVQKSAEEQLAQARSQAEQIVAHARMEAENSRERVLKESQRELRELAAQAAKQLAFHADPFDQFLNLAEEGDDYAQ